VKLPKLNLGKSKPAQGADPIVDTSFGKAPKSVCSTFGCCGGSKCGHTAPKGAKR